MQIASPAYLPPSFLVLPVSPCLSLLFYASYPNICHAIKWCSFFICIAITENTCNAHTHQLRKAAEWNMKYCSRGAIIYVPPISGFIGLTVTTVWIFLPYSISRTGSCLHKEVNYDTNNNVGVPGRDGGGGEGEGWVENRRGLTYGEDQGEGKDNGGWNISNEAEGKKGVCLLALFFEWYDRLIFPLVPSKISHSILQRCFYFVWNLRTLSNYKHIFRLL